MIEMYERKQLPTNLITENKEFLLCPKYLLDVADEFGMYCFPTGSRSWGVNNEN